jgi:hypothetical protein
MVLSDYKLRNMTKCTKYLGWTVYYEIQSSRNKYSATWSINLLHAAESFLRR